MTDERLEDLRKTSDLCLMLPADARAKGLWGAWSDARMAAGDLLAETLDEIKRLRAENARLKRHIELRDHAAEDERECRRCGMVFCECPGGKR